ncbi:MAG: DUF2066 domain-containing protein [Gammaproteobacteria bacterium]|nr:DUF2066 domain-containing protein [Gammaproteobacteria bacterium]
MHRLFFVLITVISTNAFSGEVADLYQSHFAVSDQSEQQRQLVAPEILRQTILKVVGDRSALDLADLSPILTQTDSLIQQYQYRRVNKISDDLTKPDQLELLLTFDQSGLNRLLADNRLPVWGKNRPDVLVWMAIKDQQHEAILADDQDNLDVKQALDGAVEMRGLPILLPVMDLSDQRLVSFSELWAGQSDVIIEASQRYAAQVILMASMTISADKQVRISWQLHINGETENWQSRGDVNYAIRSGIDELTDRLARRFSQVVATSAAGQEYELYIKNIRDYADYARVTHYLNDLQYVSHVEIKNLAQDELVLAVSIEGDLAVFDRTLAIGQLLRKDTAADVTHTMQYRFTP